MSKEDFKRCECGGLMLPWNASLVYRGAEDKVELRCVGCGKKCPMSPKKEKQCHI